MGALAALCSGFCQLSDKAGPLTTTSSTSPTPNPLRRPLLLPIPASIYSCHSFSPLTILLALINTTCLADGRQVCDVLQIGKKKKEGGCFFSLPFSWPPPPPLQRMMGNYYKRLQPNSAETRLVEGWGEEGSRRSKKKPTD